MTSGPSRPRLERVDGVRSRAVGDEFVVLDQATGRAHALSGVTAQVWNWCGGGPAPDADAEDRRAASEALVAAGLLRPAGVSRRGMLRTGAGLAAGVGIASIVLPEASAAASTLVTGPKTGSTNPFTIPKGSRNISITLIGGSGGYAQDHSGAPGTGGSVMYTNAGPLAADVVVTYVVGKQGTGPVNTATTSRKDLFTSVQSGTAPGGTGAFTGGSGGGNGDTSGGNFPDLGGGGGGASKVTFTGGVTGVLIAGGGGGAGDGYYSDFTTAGQNTGGNGGSVGAGGIGGAGSAGTTGTLAGLGGLGTVLGGGGGANGTSGTTSNTQNTNGGGGGGAGGLAGGAGLNGGNNSSAAGGGGAGSSSNPNLLPNVTFGTVGTIGDGLISYSYTAP